MIFLRLILTFLCFLIFTFAYGQTDSTINSVPQQKSIMLNKNNPQNIKSPVNINIKNTNFGEPYTYKTAGNEMPPGDMNGSLRGVTLEEAVITTAIVYLIYAIDKKFFNQENVQNRKSLPEVQNNK